MTIPFFRAEDDPGPDFIELARRSGLRPLALDGLEHATVQGRPEITHGTTVVASFRVNTTIHGIQSSPAVAADAAGNFVVAWAGRGAGDKQGVFFQRYDAAGVAQGGETLVNETTGGAQFDPAVAVATDGAFVVTWSGVGGGDFAGVFMRRFDASGVAQSGETPVNSTTDDQQTEPAAAFDAAGNLAIAWTSRHQDVSDLGVFAQRYDAAGNALGAEFGLSATTAASPSTCS